MVPDPRQQLFVSYCEFWESFVTYGVERIGKKLEYVFIFESYPISYRDRLSAELGECL